MTLRGRMLILLAGASLLVGPALAAESTEDGPEPAVDPKLFQALEYRNIGPSRGGRSTAVTGVPGETLTYYMGTTGGGVWKTTDAGITWRSVSDEDFQTASVGAVAVAASDPNVVYAGMGSACIRGNVSPGNGVYRSTDAGRSWKHVGLEDAGQIARIRVHPTNPDVAWVAALGHAFGPNPERGVFRTTDGGGTWEKVLFVSDQAGAADLVLDPTNPRILYAAIWEAVRKPWTLDGGGEESGLHVSRDGGDTWEEVTEGLPEGIKGRIGVAVSGARPSRIWALVEAEKGGLFRSDDGGKSFKLINPDRNFRQRAWYYTHVYADPKDASTVYVLNTGLWRSHDGGTSFEFIRAPHGDHHDLWINPDDPRNLINANDGGANVSFNGGASWSAQDNQPTAEIYRVTVDDQFPYWVYGSQQDNSSIAIASRSTGSGITLRDWHPVGGCESGHVAVDPRQPTVTYTGCYGGTIDRHDAATDSYRQIMAWPQLAVGQAARDLKYRFQWNAPIRISPHDPKVLYHCSQHVHRSTNEGQSWEIISPDLSHNDVSKQDYAGGPLTWDNTGVEVYGTIFAFEESPHEPGLLWAGTDDGRVHLSRDAGETWDEITPKGLPEWATVNTVELSAHGAGRAFLAVQRYRMDDFRPYVYRTDDYGASWDLLTDGTNGIPEDHFVRVVREDPDRKGLLYAGTEFGMYVSFDDGRQWQRFQLKLPVTPVTDLAVRHQDLIVATQGRSFWILDDLTPLHQLDETVAEADAHLFAPRDAVRFGGGGGFPGGDPRAGKNPPYGAVIHYSLAEAPEEGEELVLEILDEGGEVLRTLSSVTPEPRAPNPYARLFPEMQTPRTLKAEAGMNRYVWNLRLADATLVDDAVLWGSARGPRVPPGTYRARLTLGEWSDTRSFQVQGDPRLEVTTRELQEQYDLARKTWEMLTETHGALAQLRDVRTQVEALSGRLDKAGAGDGMEEATKALLDRLSGVETRLTQVKTESFQDILNFPPQLDNQIVALLGTVAGGQARPTAGSHERFEELRGELDTHLAELQGAYDTELAAFDELVRGKALGAVVVVPR
jgi:photosystem II stability/assembly factor-like uncharacterized protein